MKRLRPWFMVIGTTTVAWLVKTREKTDMEFIPRINSWQSWEQAERTAPVPAGKSILNEYD